MQEFRFNVFGTLIAITGSAGSWQAFHLGADGKRRPADFIIPADVADHELGEYLADLFHENATPQNGTVEIATHASDILIRRANQGDRHRLTDLMHSSSAYRGKYAAILAGYEISSEQIENDLMYVAEHQRQLMGFFSLTDLGNNPELDLMFVSDQAQGKGIGRLLFDHLRTVARENGVTRIHIVAHPPAEQFYLRMGAARIGTKEAGGKVSWARPVLSLEIKNPRP